MSQGLFPRQLLWRPERRKENARLPVSANDVDSPCLQAKQWHNCARLASEVQLYVTSESLTENLDSSPKIQIKFAELCHPV